MDLVIRPIGYLDRLAVHLLLKSANLSTDISRCSIRLTGWVDGELVGFCGVEFWDEYASLRGLIVRRDRRKLGLGKALVAKSVAISLKRGMKGVFAYTYFWNIRFYSSCGFERIEKPTAPQPIKECADFHQPNYKCCCLLRFEED